MRPTRIRAAVALLAMAVAYSVALAGCSASQDQKPGDAGAGTSASAEPSSSSASPSPSFSDSPSTSPSLAPSLAPSASPSVTTVPGTSPSAAATTPSAAARAATIEDALLSASEMPRLSPTSAWAQRRTGPLGSKPFGLCQKFDLLTIGAVSGVERGFVTGAGSAAQQVAEFPDAKNTVRAGRIVAAWQRDCAGRVRGSSVKVSPVTEVSVSSGKAWSYLVSYQRGGTGRFHSLGVVLSGARMTLLRIDYRGQDRNYGSGREPIELAVKAASSKLG